MKFDFLAEKGGVWLRLLIEDSNLVHPAIQEGFKYHHAELNHLMLVHWFSDDPSTLPANASHQVGIGAFVLNDRQEAFICAKMDPKVLALQERHGVFQGTEIWKMPPGTVNQGEDIFAGAIREVKEETGVLYHFLLTVNVLEIVKSKFLHDLVLMVTFGNVNVHLQDRYRVFPSDWVRQAHKVAFDKTDLFFLCMLRPLTSRRISIQNSELNSAKWLPIAEYRDQEYLGERKMLKKMLHECIETTKPPAYKGFTAEDMQAGTNRKPQYFYYSTDNCRDQ